MTSRWSAVAALCALLVACMPGEGDGAHGGSELSQGPRGRCRGAGTEPPAAPEPALSVEVIEGRGELSARFALPALPLRAAFDPQIGVIHDGATIDVGSGFGAGFALDVPSITTSIEYGLTLRTLPSEADPLRTPVTYQGARLLPVLGSGGVPEYRPESSEAPTRVYYHAKSTELSLGKNGTLTFHGFLVVHADGQREVYTEDPAVAEQDVATDASGATSAVTTRFPLQYRIAQSGDVITYGYTKKPEDNRSYLTSVSFAGGRSRWEFHLDKVPNARDRVVYDQGFAQRQTHLYTKITGIFDKVVIHRLYPVYRTSNGRAADLFVHADVTAEARTTFAVANTAAPLSEDSTLLGIMRVGRVTGSATVGPNTPRLPTLRFFRADRTYADLSKQVAVQTLDVRGVAGFGENAGGEFVDVNQDGLVDVVATAADRAATAVFLNRGGDGFERSADLTVVSNSQSAPVVPSFRGGGGAVWLPGDFDGDGVSDLLEIARASSTGGGSLLTLYPGEPGRGAAFAPARGSFPSPRAIEEFADGRAQPADLNADGRDDLVISERQNGAWRFTVLLNMTKTPVQPGQSAVHFIPANARFDPPALFDLPALAQVDFSLAAPEMRLTDVNGDGLVDLSYVRFTKDGDKGVCVFENRGAVRANVDSGRTSVRFNRLFGDDSSTSPTCPSGYFAPIEGLESLATVNALWLVDFSGDGVSDLVNVVEDPGSADRHMRLMLWLGRGRGGFQALDHVKLGTSLRVDPVNRWNTRVLDIDGDGQLEVVIYELDQTGPRLRVIDFNRAGDEDLVAPLTLTALSEGAGIRHLVQYASSTDELLRDRRLGRNDVAGIPFVVPVVKRLVTQVALAPSSVREYQYHGPRLNLIERSLLGFRNVDVAEHGDAQTDGALSQLTFAQKADRHSDRLLADREEARIVSTLAPAPTHRAILETLDAAPRDGPPNIALVSQLHETRTEAALTAAARHLETRATWSTDAVPSADRRPLYIRQDSAEEARFGACTTTNCPAARISTQYRYDTCNRLYTEARTAHAVTGIDRIDVPERREQRVTEFVNPCDGLGPRTPDPISLTNARTTTRSAGERVLEQVTYAYDLNPFLPSAVTTRTSIDTRGLDPTVARAVVPVPARTELYEYDDFLNVRFLRDEPAGTSGQRKLVEETRYDGTGVRVAARLNGLGQAERYSYTSESLEPTTITSRRNDVVTQRFDDLQRLSSSTRNDDIRTTFAYHEADLGATRRVLVSEARSVDETTATLYVARADGLSLMRVEPGEDGRARAQEVRAYGRRGRSDRAWLPYLLDRNTQTLFEAPEEAPWQPDGAAICADGRVSCTSYDALGRIVRMQAASGKVDEDVRYEPWGRREEVADEAGSRARSWVARDDVVYGLVDELEKPHRYERDEADQLAAIWLAGEQTPRRTLADSAGRVLYSAIPHGQTLLFTRDYRGRLVRQATFDRTFASGGSIQFRYDDLDRPLRRESRGPPPDEEPFDAFLYAYDQEDGGDVAQVGSLVRATAEDALTGSTFVETFRYDAEGRMLARRASFTRGSLTRAYEAESWRYSLDGKPTSYTDPFGHEVEYALTPSGQVGRIALRGAAGPTTLLEGTAFDAFGNLTTVARSSHRLTQSLTYDPSTGLLTTLRTCREGSQECAQHDAWTRRGDGRVIAHAATDLTSYYSYTPRGELARAEWGDLAYTYDSDPAGYLLRSSEPGSGSFSRTDGAMGLLAGYRDDDFGRLTSRPGSERMRYDPGGRLRSVTHEGVEIAYVYSALGERVARIADEAVTVYPTARTRDDGSERQSLIVHEERPVALLVDGSPRFALLSDHRGVVEGLIDREGRAAARWRFSPYGVLASDAPDRVSGLHSMELVRSFTGSLRDDDTGLVHMGTREYLPETGGFTTPDPLFQSDPGLCVARPRECAPYGYVGQDPINYVDRTGTIRGSISNVARRVGTSVRSMARQAKQLAKRALGQGRAAQERRMSAQQAIDRGLVREGGSLVKVLREVEAGFARQAPRSEADAMTVIAQATARVGLEPGVFARGAGGEAILRNVGGVTTTIRANGSIVIQRGADVVLRLLP